MRQVVYLCLIVIVSLAGCNSEPETLPQEDDIITELVASGIEIHESDLRWVETSIPEFGISETVSHNSDPTDSEPFLFPDVNKDNSQELPSDVELYNQIETSQPIIETRRDLLAHLVGPGGIGQLQGKQAIPTHRSIPKPQTLFGCRI